MKYYKLDLFEYVVLVFNFIFLFVIIIYLYSYLDNLSVNELIAASDLVVIEKADTFLFIFFNNLITFTISIFLFGIGTQLIYFVNIFVTAALFIVGIILSSNPLHMLQLIIPHLVFEILAFNIALLLGYRLFTIFITLLSNRDDAIFIFNSYKRTFIILYALIVFLTLIGALIEVNVSGRLL